jgi:L-ascorbate metabolism protein UlaG (beta-lactamase superfamily)
MKSLWFKLLTASLALVVVLAICVWIYLQHPKFGEMPKGDRLALIERSPHYVDGEFRNLTATPMFSGDRSLVSTLVSSFRNRGEVELLRPLDDLPSVITDLHALDRNEDLVVWFGHSSYFVQVGGKRLLIDPVFSEDAAPIPWVNRAFAGTTPYTAEDMPDIDYLLITHDHWDHLDHPSVVALAPRVGAVITGLGVGAHFERWGYPQTKIRESDWNTAVALDEGFSVHVLPARHYSGRMLRRNRTLWVSFAVEAPGRKLYFSGDSGYGPHFAQIGKQFGGFDLVALDGGQYNPRWPYIHMTPEEAVQASRDLRGRAVVPAHVGRFKLARHPWDEPFERFVAASEKQGIKLLTPRIGEPVMLADDEKQFERWWQAAGGRTPGEAG